MKIASSPKDLRLRAALLGTAGREFFELAVTDPPRGSPVGAAAFIVPDGECGNNPCMLSEYYDFQRK
jgi:hypothetical protein